MTLQSELKRLGLFDARVPRYTSYPTAPQFGPAVDAATVAFWIGAIPKGAKLSLYVHIPFCRRLCWFCACRTQGTTTMSPVVAYVDTLKAELALLRDTLPHGVSIGHLHWGGGTPTLLTPAMITDLASAIFATMPLADKAQFSVEIDPNEIDEPRLDALAAAGMNRASLGIQDFDPKIQDTIGRPQSYAITRAAVDGLRLRGINSLNADIVYGLPHQTTAGITRTVQQVLSLDPNRIALFGYAHVPWMAKRQTLIPTDALPGAPERLNLFETARQLFTGNGFDEIGIDHFARPADGLAVAHRNHQMRRNFQGYTEDTAETLIGLGASSISRYRQGYAQNASATSAYQGLIRAGELAISRGHALTPEDALRGAIIEALLCDFRADLAGIARRLGHDPSAAVALADGLPEAFPGMAHIADRAIEISGHGRPLARMIARHFDAYAMSKTGHSQAV